MLLLISFECLVNVSNIIEQSSFAAKNVTRGNTLPPIRNRVTSPIIVSQNSGIEKTLDINLLTDTNIHMDELCSSTTLDLNINCSFVKENSITANNVLLPSLRAIEVCRGINKSISPTNKHVACSGDSEFFNISTSENILGYSDVNTEEVSQILRQCRIDNLNNVIIAHLNVNHFAKKLDMIKTIIPGYVDIIIFGETKLDSSYPTSQLLMDGFSKPYRQDRNCNGGGGGSYLCQRGHT